MSPILHGLHRRADDNGHRAPGRRTPGGTSGSPWTRAGPWVCLGTPRIRPPAGVLRCRLSGGPVLEIRQPVRAYGRGDARMRTLGGVEPPYRFLRACRADPERVVDVLHVAAGDGRLMPDESDARGGRPPKGATMTIGSR